MPDNANDNLNRSVADLLLERNLIKPDDVKRAEDIASKEGAFLEDALFSLAVVPEEELMKVIGEAYTLPYIDLSDKKIPFVIISKFPENIAKKYNIVVFEMVSDQMLKVALAKPWDPVTRKALDFIRTNNHINIDPYVVTPKGLLKALEQYKNPVMVEKQTGAEEAPAPAPVVKPEVESAQGGSAVGGEKKPAPKAPEEKKKEEEANIQVEAPEVSDLVKEDVENLDQLKELIKNSAIPRIVAAIIKYGVTSKASDIHIEPMEGADTRVRYRIDGILHDLLEIPGKDHSALVARVKILSKLKIDEQRIPQDGRIDIKFGEKEIDLRISTFPTITGEKVVMRILDKTGGVVSIKDIGLSGEPLDLFMKAIQIPHGILLVTGPTGSGKSTTLYSAISIINKEAVNVVTLEDPVEYQMNGVNQSQVKPYIGYTFASGLRSILRQDPNVIMVGEIRDKETAEMAVQSALTGHLVLSTLHTNDAAGAIPRLIDMGVEPFLIGSSLHTVVAQRLVRKVCPDCKKEVKMPEVVNEDIKQEFEKIPDKYKTDLELKPADKKMFVGEGCAKCNGTGYKGRFGIFELLPLSEPIQQLAIKRASSADILNQALKEGMITMKQDGILKVLRGQTTMEEVYRVTSI
jgi:type IV pilus assembly protein PilB